MADCSTGGGMRKSSRARRTSRSAATPRDLRRQGNGHLRVLVGDLLDMLTRQEHRALRLLVRGKARVAIDLTQQRQDRLGPLGERTRRALQRGQETCKGGTCLLQLGPCLRDRSPLAIESGGQMRCVVLVERHAPVIGNPLGGQPWRNRGMADQIRQGGKGVLVQVGGDGPQQPIRGR